MTATARTRGKSQNQTPPKASQGQSQANTGVTNNPSRPDPNVGDKVTIQVGTDLRPAITIKRTPKRCVVRECRAVLLNGPACKETEIPNGISAIRSGDQLWHVSEDQHGHEVAFTLRKNGRWTLSGAYHGDAPEIANTGWSPRFDFTR